MERIETIWKDIERIEWNELPNCFYTTAKKFAEKALKCSDISMNNIINTNKMERFKAIIKKFSSDLYSYSFDKYLLKGNDVACEILLWITLGSITEFVLQTFLAIYLFDYEESKWQQWDDFETDQIKEEIINTINTLINEKKITNSQGKSLKEAVKDHIKKHTTLHPIETVMLDELIQFYKANDLISELDIEDLKIIQRNRNSIHSFLDREIDSIEKIELSVRFLMYLMESFVDRFPSCEELDIY